MDCLIFFKSGNNIYILCSGNSADNSHWRIQIDSIGCYEMFKLNNTNIITTKTISQHSNRNCINLFFLSKNLYSFFPIWINWQNKF